MARRAASAVRAVRYPVRVPARRRPLPGDSAAERLLERGPRGLDNEELLSLVMGPGVDTLAAAKRLLEVAGGVARLSQAPPGQLAQWGGVRASRLARVLAAIELGRRASYPADGRAPCFRSPGEVGRYLLARYGNREIEEFGVLLLDTRGCLRRAEIISQGSMSGTFVHPRDLFRFAIAYQAASIILFHNHPSGNPSPSPADRQITERLQEAGRVIGVPILDHVVLGSGRWFSFNEAGEL